LWPLAGSRRRILTHNGTMGVCNFIIKRTSRAQNVCGIGLNVRDSDLPVFPVYEAGEMIQVWLLTTTWNGDTVSSWFQRWFNVFVSNTLLPRWRRVVW
jgi:hypothetical protein